MSIKKNIQKIIEEKKSGEPMFPVSKFSSAYSIKNVHPFSRLFVFIYE